jgi:hypothetical protein
VLVGGTEEEFEVKSSLFLSWRPELGGGDAGVRQSISQLRGQAIRHTTACTKKLEFRPKWPRRLEQLARTTIAFTLKLRKGKKYFGHIKSYITLQ